MGFLLVRSTRWLSGLKVGVAFPVSQVNATDLVLVDLEVVVEPWTVGVSQDAQRLVVFGEFVFVVT